ncbi:hypothetical protein JOQ06_020843 [Pogonophryne albipinna]|uniref:Uncharacterized protein n=1 Tax=Pogonophryne albipinna TaxID=1090488 RepID=A0AAD6BR51_9TELE|nr:hypothetical protein JOQ06_020843 [Pogonophryne albipinna]
MGERDTVWQEPGYDGICNYAQRITSCFGLDADVTHVACCLAAPPQGGHPRSTSYIWRRSQVTGGGTGGVFHWRHRWILP